MIGGSIGMEAGSVEPPPSMERVVITQKLVIPTEENLVIADPKAVVSFKMEAVTSKRAPKPKIGVASLHPLAQSSINFNVEATLAAAKSEVGKSFPTGWNQQGECIMSVKRWIGAGKGNWYGSGTPVANYAGAKEIEYKHAAPGDVIQYISTSNPNAWVAGVHTVLVTANNADGTLQIIESNNPGGSGYVSANKKWTPAPPSGLTFKVFRF